MVQSLISTKFKELLHALSGNNIRLDSEKYSTTQYYSNYQKELRETEALLLSHAFSILQLWCLNATSSLDAVLS